MQLAPSAIDLRVAPSAIDLRVAVPVAVAWITTALLVGVPDVAPVVGGAAALLTGASGSVLRWRRGAGVVPAVAGLLLVAGALTTLLAVSVSVGDSRRAPEPLRALVAGPRAGHVEVEAVLTRDLVPGDRSVTATLVRADDLDGLRVPVRLVPDQHGDAPGTVLAAGARVTVTATLQPDEPGSATAFVAFLRGTPSSVPPDGLLGATDTARQAFVRATADLPQPGAALLRGLAIGDRSGLDPTTEGAMETSALTHLTAVSGDMVRDRGGFRRLARSSSGRRTRALPCDASGSGPVGHSGTCASVRTGIDYCCRLSCCSDLRSSL